MQQVLYGLNYDYIDQNGHFLIIRREIDLTNDDLDPIQINMLHANKIARLLAVEIEERDLAVQLRYNMGSKKSLHNIIQGRPIKLAEYYQLLLSIITTLEDSKNYMLDINNYVLDDRFIFAGRDLSEIALLYLPLKELTGKRSIGDDVAALIGDLSEYVDDLKVNELKALKDFCKQAKGTLDLSGLKQILVSLMNNRHLNVPKSHVSADVQSMKNEKEVVPNKVVSAPEAIVNVDQMMYPSSISAPAAEPAILTNETNKEIPPLSERGKVITICVSILAIACIWKVYLFNPSEGLLYLCTGLSILVLDVMYIIIKVWRPGLQATSKVNLQADITSLNKPKEEVQALKKSKKTKQQTQIQEEVPPAKSPSLPPTDVQYYSNQGDKTTLLSRYDETQVLTSPAPLEEKTTCPWFEVVRDGNVEKIDITQPFVVGRKEDSVNYLEQGSGVSRVHMKVLKSKDGWALMDLNSKNYTFINGEQLKPNKEYPLNDGDVVKLATVEYQFKLGV